MFNLVMPDGTTKTVATQAEADMAVSFGAKLANAPEAAQKEVQIAAIKAAQERAKVRRAENGTSVLDEADFVNGEASATIITVKGKLIHTRKSRSGNEYDHLFAKCGTKNVRILVPIEADASNFVEGAVITLVKGEPTTTGSGFLCNVKV